MPSKPGVSTHYLRVPTLNGAKIYEPLPHQREFHEAPEKYRWLVGGLGAGKTITNCVEAFLTSQEYPGSVGLIGRWNWSELIATTWHTLKKIIPDRWIVDLVEGQNKCYVDILAPEGKVSRIWGWHLSNVNRLGSLELDWFGIDEGGLIEPKHGPELWRQLSGRLRGVVGPRRGWVTGTPRGKDWLWKLFVQKGFRGFRCIHARTADNPYLPEDYEQEFRRTTSREWQERWLEARFNDFEGAVYWQWSEAIHVFRELHVPAHWPLFLSMDWGLSDPCAAHLLTADEAGNVYVIREYYQANRLVSDQCREIRAMIAGVRPDFHLDWGVVDPSADRRDQVTGESLLTQYRKGGLPLQPGSRDVDGGIAAVQEWLKVDPDRVHPFTGRPGSPRLYVAFECVNLREQMGSYVWGPDGKPMKGEDHAVDSLRYGMVRRPHAADPLRGDPVNRDWQEFWDAMARDEGWDGAELPLIGAGARGRMVA